MSRPERPLALGLQARAMKPLLVAFVGGLALIIGVRLLAPHFGGEMTAAAIAAAIAVGVVAWLGFYYHKDEGRDRGSAGDDLYYLGLLFTLCSMSHTLIELVVDAEEAQARFQQLIGSFGIALVSTIAGILGRILLQAGAAPVAQSEGEQRPAQEAAAAERSTAASEEIAQAGEDTAQTMLALRRDLREASAAFVHFTRVTLAHGESVKAHTERVVEDFNRSIDGVAAQGVNSTTNAWTQAAASMAAATERLLGRIDEHTANAAQRTEATWDQLAAASSATAEAARARLDEDAEQMATLLGHMAATGQALASLDAQLASTRNSVAGLGNEATEAATRIGDQTAATGRAHSALANGAARVQETIAQTLGKTAEQIAALRDGLAEQGRLWQSAAENFAAATAAERQRQAAIADEARKSLDELAAGVAAARSDIATLGDTMKSAVDEFAVATAAERQHQASVVSAARRSLGELATGIADIREATASFGATTQAAAADVAAVVEQARQELGVERKQEQPEPQPPRWLGGLPERLRPRFGARAQGKG